MNRLVKEESTAKNMKWFYQQPILNLPKKLPDEKDFFDFYNENADDYIKLIQDIIEDPANNQAKSYPCCNELKENLSKIRFLKDSISKAIKLYYEGFPFKAYNSFLKGLQHVKSEIIHLVSNSINKDSFNDTWDMFKVSTWEDSKNQRREDIFHVPFDKRRNIKTYRYSIPGLPALYLGNSLYSCFKECSISSLEKPVYLSHFRVKKETKFLDLGITVKYLRQNLTTTDLCVENKFSFLMKEYLICWPLFLACSIFTKHNDDSFKPEYIIPQFLMQSIRENALDANIDGIRYFSVRNELDYHSLRLTNNFAFPIKTFGLTGFCNKLNEHFEWTKPIHYQEILKKAKICGKSELASNNEKYCYKVDGKKYGETDFGLVERYIKANPNEYGYDNLH